MISTLTSHLPPGLKRRLSKARDSLKERIYTPHEREANCLVRDLSIRVGVASDVEQYRVTSYSTKEPETLDWLDQSLNDSDVFFDVGANIGLYSMYAAKRQPG